MLQSLNFFVSRLFHVIKIGMSIGTKTAESFTTYVRRWSVFRTTLFTIPTKSTQQQQQSKHWPLISFRSLSLPYIQHIFFLSLTKIYFIKFLVFVSSICFFFSFTKSLLKMWLTIFLTIVLGYCLYRAIALPANFPPGSNQSIRIYFTSFPIVITILFPNYINGRALELAIGRLHAVLWQAYAQKSRRIVAKIRRYYRFENRQLQVFYKL